MPAIDALTQLQIAARSVWNHARLFPQDGGIICVVPHDLYVQLGHALERVDATTQTKRHRSVILRGSAPASGEQQVVPPVVPDADAALGTPELGLEDLP